MRNWIAAMAVTACVLQPMARPLSAQDGRGEDPARVASYLRAVATHFRVPVDEVLILSEWDLAPDAVPVILFLADRSGISPDVVVALRRAGNGWAGISARYGLGADLYHVPLGPEGGGELLGPLYRRFDATPRARWGSVPLTDSDIVALVNLRVLSQALGVSPDAVVDARGRGGSFVAAHWGLGGGRQ